LSTAVGASEQPGLLSPYDAAERPLGGIVGQADASILEHRSALDHVVHGLGHIVVPGQPGTLFAHPGVQFGDQRGTDTQSRKA